MLGGVASGGPRSGGTAAGGLTSGALMSGGAMSGGLTAHGSPGGSAGAGVRKTIVSPLVPASTGAPQKSQKVDEGSIVLLQLEQVIRLFPPTVPSRQVDKCFLRNLVYIRFGDDAIDDCIGAFKVLGRTIGLECGQVGSHDSAADRNDGDNIINSALEASHICGV